MYLYRMAASGFLNVAASGLWSVSTVISHVCTSESVCNQTSLPGFPFQFVHNACVCQLVPLKHKLLGLGLVIPLLQVLLVRHLLIV